MSELPPIRKDGACRQCGITLVEDLEKPCYKCESTAITTDKVRNIHRDQSRKLK